MKPGMMNFPFASIVRFAVAPAKRPTTAMILPRIPTSAYIAGFPVPSNTRPPVIRTSKADSAGCGA
jgi:hypothetical protein